MGDNLDCAKTRSDRHRVAGPCRPNDRLRREFSRRSPVVGDDANIDDDHTSGVQHYKSRDVYNASFPDRNPDIQSMDRRRNFVFWR